MSTAHTGADVLAAGLMLAEQDRAQGSFAFNRARKCLIQLGLIETNAFKPYGMMGKQKAAFHHLIQVLPEDALSRMKSAMMMTAEDWRAPRIRHRTRRGRGHASDEEVGSDEEAESASQTQAVEQLAYTAPHLYSLDFPTPASAPAAPTAAPITPASSAAIAESFKRSRKTTKAEEAEILRSLQAARLADAMKHESFKMLEPEQQAAIKSRWLQTLMN